MCVFISLWISHPNQCSIDFDLLKGERACLGAGSDDGFVGFIENSCTGKLSMTT